MSAAAIAIPAALKGFTSLFGGLQSRGAINDAVSALLQSFGNAGEIGREATGRVNQEIKNDAWHWGDMVQASAQDAGNWARDAADKGIAGVNGAVAQGQAAVQPWMSNGTSASDSLLRMLQKPEQFNYQADPGYQFRLSEGMKAVQRQAAAHGAAGGGGTAKAAAQYASGLASQEYGNSWNRWNAGQQQKQSGLATLAGMGERAGEFSGELGLRGSTFNAGLGTNAAQFAGGLWNDANKWAGNASMNAVGRSGQNDLDLANFLANLQIQGGRTRATGDLMKSGVNNDMIGNIGGVIANLPWGKWFPAKAGNGGGQPWQMGG